MDYSGSLFEDALEKFGVAHTKNGKSIVLKDCHSCGNSNYKLWMFRPTKSAKDPNGSRTIGNCWVCGHRANSYNYLLNYADKDEVKEALGLNTKNVELGVSASALSEMFDEFLDDLNRIEYRAADPVSNAKAWDMPPHYRKVSDSQMDASAKYAIRRGVIGHLQDEVFIDPTCDAVVFPIYSANETLVGFQKRYLTPRVFKDKNGKEISMKCKTEGGAQKTKGVIMFGKSEDPVCLVEGPFDAIAAAWFGFYGICTMGASPSRAQVEIAISYSAANGKPLHIGYDTDEAGEKGSKDAAKLCDCYGVSFKRVVPFAQGEDFGSMLEKHSGFNVSIQDEVLQLDGMVKELRKWLWYIPWP
jgi:hypothetical protein